MSSARTPTARPVLDEEVEREPALADFRRRSLDRRDERALDLGAGGVAAGVHDAGGGVAAFARQGEPGRLAVSGLVEVRAHGDELAHAVGAFGDEHPHRVGVAETGAGGDGVGEVQLGRVVESAVERGGDATLRVRASPSVPSSPFVRTITDQPARAAWTAADRPATPLPSTRRSNIGPAY